ncbi:hypothetical protein ANCDUO_20570, partial [Ancylostoma duodenale]
DEDDVSASASIIDCPNSEPAFVIDKETRNINLWKVNVSKIQPMRDNTTGRTIYVYVIDVERTEAKEKETKSWSICRRFSEFYVLEMKLLEFHGDSLRFTLLPPRKTLLLASHHKKSRIPGATSSVVLDVPVLALQT